MCGSHVCAPGRTIDSLPWEAGRPDFDVASVYPDLAADDYLFEMLLMVFNNVGQALSGLGRVTDAFFYHTAATSLLEAKLAGIPPTDGIERVATIDNLMHTKAHLFRSSKVSPCPSYVRAAFLFCSHRVCGRRCLATGARG